MQLGGESNGQRHGEGRPRRPLYSYPYLCGLVRDDTTKADRVDGGKEKWPGEMWNEKMSSGEVGCG